MAAAWRPLRLFSVAFGPARLHFRLDGCIVASMESYPDNFETGSWTVRKTVRRPKTRFFTLLACVWLMVAAGASFPFWHGWPVLFSGLEWFCVGLILLEFVFVGMAVSCWFTERGRLVREPHRNLEYMRRARL